MIKINEKWRQMLHIEPPQGWLNDPNGLCFFNGKYHVYFQYSPESPLGNGPRGWGHYESTDMLDWTFTGFVIRPDIPEDKDGAYSGSAIVHDNKMYIFYTGNVKEDGEYDYIVAGRKASVICVTSKDGHTMSEKKVILTNSDYPEFCSCHVRDPKVWYENGKWRMVLGARTLSDKGCVLYYSSNNLENWEYDGYESIPDFGYMWECPDCFMLDNHHYLSISPQGLAQEKTRFQNVYQSGYFKVESELADFEEWDYGFDFYAPQTFVDSKGRHIIIGWMGIADSPFNNPTASFGWQHCLTLPREITREEDGALLQNPIKEMDALRSELQVLYSGDDTKVMLPFDFTAKTKNDYEIVLAEEVCLKYDSAEKLFILKFLNKEIGGERTQRLVEINQCDDIRIVADKSSMEIYLNHGRKVLSTRFYPQNDNISVKIVGADAHIYSLKREVQINE